MGGGERRGLGSSWTGVSSRKIIETLSQIRGMRGKLFFDFHMYVMKWHMCACISIQHMKGWVSRIDDKTLNKTICAASWEEWEGKGNLFSTERRQVIE